MAIDINLLDWWGRWQEQQAKAWSYQGPPQPSDPILQWRFLDDIREQYARTRTVE